MNREKHILVVDDEKRIRDVVEYALTKDGFRVSCAAHGAEALLSLQNDAPDLIVLDVMLPGLDGLELCRRVRTRSNIPILFLSARGDEVDRVVGLEVGGDDYLTKPFSPRELVARVRAVLRRFGSTPPEMAASDDYSASHHTPGGGAGRGAQQGSHPPSTTDRAPPLSEHGHTSYGRSQPSDARQGCLRHGCLELDLSRWTAHCGQHAVALTATEFMVLAALLERPGVVLTRQQLMQRSHSGGVHVTERTLDTHVRRIRAKFRAFAFDPITTVHGVGYKACTLSG